MAIIQFRVDDKLKQEASELYDRLGLDLSTALRMFLKRSVDQNGIPFSVHLGDVPPATEAIKLLEQCQKRSKELGNDKMTLEEINEIISLSRKERKKKNEKK